MQLAIQASNPRSRLLVSMGAGFAVTVGLFFFMYYLISNPNTALGDQGPTVSITFEQIDLDDDMKLKEREIPKKPPPPKDPPPPPKMQVQEITPTAMPMPMNLNLNLAYSGTGPYLGTMGIDRNADGDVIPLVRIQPIYPRKAAMDRLEGWVEVEFTITETGSVTDVAVQGFSDRVFVRPAVRSILKWKYKPRIEGGVALTRHATLIMEFKLHD
jgi:protein TonB